MTTARIFESIRIDIPERAILRRLGFRRNATEASPERQAQVLGLIKQAVQIIELRGSCLTLGLSASDGQSVTLADGTVFTGSGLRELLASCDQALLMGATAGPAVMQAISAATAAGDMLTSVVYDATASEMTDKALNWLMDYHARTLRRQGRRLTERRYSAGYGDFALENQQEFHRLLELESIGVSITETSILSPEKSVTAVCGIIPPAKPAV